MPAATTKFELQDTTVREYDKLVALIAPLCVSQAMKKREDDTSIKDVIAHRAHWIDLFLGWHADGLAGREVHFPAPGYNWSQLKAYNANLREQQANLEWDEARASLGSRHKALLAFIASSSNTDLYGGPMKGARNDWASGRWAEAAGASHYRSAAKWIRACLRKDASSETKPT